MELNILGLKIRLEVILLSIILFWLIGGYTICACSKVSSVKEGFQALGAPIGWRTGEGVPGDTWDIPSKDTTTTLFQSLDGIKADKFLYQMIKCFYSTQINLIQNVASNHNNILHQQVVLVFQENKWNF